MPLESLWDSEGDLRATRARSLDREGVRDLLRRGPVRFVIARSGQQLRWIPLGERFSAWKTDIDAHLSAGDRVDLEKFPGGMAYVASEWVGAKDDIPIVLLEALH
jgi:hypothetical protein